MGAARHARHKPVGDLKLTAGTSGTISGSIDLTPDQVTALNASRLYINCIAKAPTATSGDGSFYKSKK